MSVPLPMRSSPLYTPLWRVASGGMGAVDLAVRQEGRFTRMVAMKRLHEHLASDAEMGEMPVGFRSLRDTGLTWLALAGVPSQHMQRRAGHDDMNTTMGYVKEAEDLTGGSLGEPFAPLPFGGGVSSPVFSPQTTKALETRAFGVPEEGVEGSSHASVSEVSADDSRSVSEEGARLVPDADAGDRLGDRKARCAGAALEGAAEVIASSIASARISPSGAADAMDPVADAAPSRRSKVIASSMGGALLEDAEAALARALTLAAEAGQWAVVAQLAKELEARRLARSGNVVALSAPSSRRGR